MDDNYILIIMLGIPILFGLGFAYFLRYSIGKLLKKFEINENYNLFIYEKTISIFRNKKIRIFGPPIFHELTYIEYKKINFYQIKENSILINFNAELNFSGKPSEYLITPNKSENFQIIAEILKSKGVKKLEENTLNQTNIN